MAIEDRIIGAESGGDPLAKNPNSTATGSGQFIAGTWLDMMARNRPDLVQGKSPDEILAMRSDPALSREMTQAYARDNTKTLTDAGLPATPGNVYLAHFAGPTGAVNVLKADPSAPAASVLDPAAVKANPFLSRMTVGDLQGWASKKVGGGPVQGAPVQPGPAPAIVPPVPAAQTGMLSGLPGLSGGSPAAAAPSGPAPAAQASPAPMAQAAPQQMPQMAAPEPLNMPLTQAAKARLFAALSAPR